MTKSVIVRVTSKEAIPFIRAYNALMNTQVADESYADQCVWCGVQVRGVVRAVLGLRAIDETTVFVWGMFGDGSGTVDEILAGSMLMHVVNELPYNLEGAILPSNVGQQRRAAKNGWVKTDTQVMCGTNDELQDLWKRSYKAGA